MLDMATGQSSQIGQHDGAVSSMRFVTTSGGPMLITGSWDRSVRVGRTPALCGLRGDQCPKRAVALMPCACCAVQATGKPVQYWDTRTPTAALVVPMSDRVYCLDAVGMLAVVATADRAISIFSLANPTTAYKVGPPLPRLSARPGDAHGLHQTVCARAAGPTAY